MNSQRETSPLICLIGYRGTGKTTVAQELSRRIGWPWIDADTELEKRAGKSIRDIFADEGEPGFRDREAEIVNELTGRARWVVSLGGGAVLRAENRTAIRRGVVVWLQAEPGDIWQRISADPASHQQRPNLTTGGIQEIEELLAVRLPLYRDCADYAVHTGGRTPDQIADEIVCLLRTHFPFVGSGP